MQSTADLIRERIEARAADARAAQDAASRIATLQLPLWADDVRGVPNALLRSALFTVSQERSVFKKTTTVASLENLEIRFKGEQWNQSDLDVWEELIHISRIQPLGEKIHFTAHSLLKALGRDTGGKSHADLREDLMRLQGGVVQINWLDKRKSFSSALVTRVYKDDDTAMYVVELSKELASLYKEGATHISWEKRRELGSNNLAKWLMGFYSSHGEPYAYKIETLHKLCGSQAKALREFRRSLKTALERLQKVGFVYRWEITPGDKLLVYKSARLAARALVRRTNEGLNCLTQWKPHHANANPQTRRNTQNG
jgi:TrfA protein